MGYHAVPVMDQTCFLGGSKSVVNFMNCTWYDTKADIELVKDKFRKACDRMPKLRYKLVEFAGDFYYEEMSTEETF